MGGGGIGFSGETCLFFGGFDERGGDGGRVGGTF